MSDQETRPTEELLTKAANLLREWLCAGPDFDIVDWSSRVRNLVEDEIDERSDF